MARAEAFATFDRNTSFVFHGCASMTEYARQYGYGSDPNCTKWVWEATVKAKSYNFV